MRRRRGGRGHGRRRAVDLRHPQGAAPRGPRRLRRTPARPAVPRRRLDGLGRPAASGCTTPTRRSPSPWSASTSTSPTPTSRSSRRCAPAASPTRPGQHPLGRRPTSARRPKGGRAQLGDVDAICVPGGFGIRGIEGKLGALTYARTNEIPTLGLCLGLQCMVIEYARSMAGLEKAGSNSVDAGLLEAGDVCGRTRSPCTAGPGTAPGSGCRACGRRSSAPSLPSMPRMPKPPGTQIASTSWSMPGGALGVGALVGRHPADVDLGLVGEAAGPQRLGHGEVGVVAGRRTCRPARR